MRTLGVILLGCALLLPATCSAAAMEKQQELFERAEEILYDLRELAGEKEHEIDDDGQIMKKGCKDHQVGEEWGTLEHNNCYCQGPDTFCYHVDCPSGIVRDSKGLWDCPGASTADGSEKREDINMLDDSLLKILEESFDHVAEDDGETHVVAEENAMSFRGSADGLINKAGCDGHQKAVQWGSSDHSNCICGGTDRFCYPVVCLPGSQLERASDSKRLWSCEAGSSKRDITESAQEVIERENIKREPVTATVVATVSIAALTNILGIVGFFMDRQEAAETTAQLNEIQDQIRELDKKVDDLTQKVSDLQLGQEYLQQVILYGRDELRLKNILATHAKLQVIDGHYAGRDIQGWADSVLSHGSDGISNVLHNLLNMVKPQSSVFGGKSLFEIYHIQLKGDLEKHIVKMPLKVGQVYGLIGGGYSAWATALRIKGHQRDIPAVVQEGVEKLKFVQQSLQKYVDYGTCSYGYHLKKRKCYQAFNFRKNWPDASAFCRSQGAGGNLAMPKDSDTNGFLIELKNYKNPHWGFWFGLNDRAVEGQWKWNDGTSLGSFNYWSPVEPNNGGKNWWGSYIGNEDCAEYFRKNWRNSNWNDVDCSQNRYFICERTPKGLY